MVEVKDILIVGFASITEPLSYTFDRNGINIILGRNGAGKSTVYNALTWVLYGTTIKGKIDIETWDDIKPKDYKGTYVSISLIINGVQVEVHRYNKYKGKAIDGAKGKSRLLIYEDGSLFETYKDKRDLQEYLTKKLGMSYRLFKNAIIFGQKLSRLLKDGGQEQKKVLDELFDTVFIDKAKKKVDTEIANTFELLFKLKSKYDIKSTVKTSLQEQLEMRLEEKSSFTSRQKKRVKEVKAEILELDSKIKSAQRGKNEARELKKKIVHFQAELLKVINVKKEYKEAKDKAFKLQMEMGQARNKMCDANDKVTVRREEYKSLKKVCTTCGQPLDKKTIQVTKTRLIDLGKKAAKAAKDATKSFEKVEKLYKQADSSERTLDEQMYHYNSINEELERATKALYKSTYNPELVKELKNNKAQLKDKIKNIEAEEFTFDFDKLKNEIVEVTNKMKKLNFKINKTHTYQSNLSWLNNNPFSNSGLKSFIFNSMLDEVNLNLERYAQVLGFGVLFEIDMNSAHKNLKAHIFKGEQVTDYDNLSGGEQQLVDIAVAFSIHDVISKNNTFNILLMDEIFESLDNDNIDLITDLIVTKSENVFVHLVTHLSEFRPSNCNIITFAKGSQKNTIVL